jgi:NitT/TauT family transport system permease protein
MSLFKLRGSLTRTQAILLGIIGLIILLVVWWLLAEAFAVEIDGEEGPAIEQVEEGDDSSSPTKRLIDLNDAPDLMPEGAPVGTLAPVQVAIEGVDTSTAVYYRLTNNVGDALAIHPSTGQLSVQTPEAVDYEKNTTLQATVAAEMLDGTVVNGNFTIQLEDQNEFPIGELSDVDPSENSLALNASAGSSTGLVAFAEDPDGGDRVLYTLTSNPSNIFQIGSSTGELVVQNSDALQRQSLGSLRIGVKAISNDGTSAEKLFSLQLTDASDAATVSSGDKAKKVYPILPTPVQVVKSYPSLIQEDELVPNTLKSIWLNFQGYFWAVVISIPIGFMIGLWPLFKGLFSRQVDALRYLPLTALTGLFIIWFGIEDQMKIAFLAFGIIVYLLPVVVQRIQEVNDVYTKTVFTLGATDWQTIRTVFFPAVMSKLIDDIRVLTAISWTYIIIAELLNRQGGIGALIYIKARQGQIPKVFAILIVIILIGFFQDRIFVYLDRRLFPHKYYKTTLAGIREIEYGIMTTLGVITLVILQQIFFPAITGGFTNIALIVIIAAIIMVGFGEVRLRTAMRNAD